jgi:hypothetical protein
MGGVTYSTGVSFSFISSFQTGFEEVSSEVKKLERPADHSPSPSIEVKNGRDRDITLLPHISS